MYKLKKAALAVFYITGLLGLFCLPAIAQLTDRLRQTEFLIKNRPDSAYLILQEIFEEAIEENNPVTEAICHQQIGQIFYNNSNYTQAVDHLLKAEKISRQQNLTENLAKNLNYLGHVYYSNKQPDLAAKQFEEALLINKQLQNLSGIAFTYGNIGHLYEKRFIYDSAYYYQQKALELYRQANDSMGMAKIFENMGSIFEDRAVFDSAKTCFENALLINRAYNDEIAQIEILNNLGDVNRKTGRYLEGLSYTRKALRLAEKTHSQYQLASAYRDMARGFELLRTFDSAYYYNDLSRGLVALDKKINTIITIAVVLVIVLLVGLGAVIISRQRLKIKNEKALDEQNKQIYEQNRELMQAELRNKQLEEKNLRSSTGEGSVAFPAGVEEIEIEFETDPSLFDDDIFNTDERGIAIQLTGISDNANNVTVNKTAEFVYNVQDDEGIYGEWELDVNDAMAFNNFKELFGEQRNRN